MIRNLNEVMVARWVGGTMLHYCKKRTGSLEPPTHQLTPHPTMSIHQAAHDLFMAVMNAYNTCSTPMPKETRTLLARLKHSHEVGTWKQVWALLDECLVSLKQDTVAYNEVVKRLLADVRVSLLMYPPQSH